MFVSIFQSIWRPQNARMFAKWYENETNDRRKKQFGKRVSKGLIISDLKSSLVIQVAKV